MSTQKNLITLCFATVFTLGLAACGGGGGGDAPASGMMDGDVDMDGDVSLEPELTELQKAQAAATQAATDAMTAAGNAKTAADNADTARANAATLQTGETSGGLAEKAREQADAARDAYADAKAASEAAAEADNVTDAVRAQVDAENARDDAQAAETKAGEYGQDSMDAAGGELMIVDTVKNVGGTSLDATAGANVLTTGEGADAQTTRTGLLKGLNPMATGAGVPEGDVFVQAMPDADPAVEGVAHKQAVAPRMFAVGKTVDSADDTARLMIVTQYDGSKSVKVYAVNDAGTDLTGRLGSDGKIQTEGTNTPDVATDDVFVTLKSVGTYYPVGTEGNDNNELEAADVVADDAEAKEVFSYGAGDATVYVVLDSTTIGTTTEVIYQPVDIKVTGPVVDEESTEMEVRASVPEATDYEHIHFGAWAALGDAKPNGSQVPADLGIGFVQSIGDGLTGADMPNNGDANFRGNWVATVRAEDPDGNGDIVLESGAASLEADFEEASIEAILTGLATLEGDIAGNTFSGTKATVMDGDPHGLDSGGKFTGEFSGGFYGARAAEAGGVFDFTSEDAEDGEFRGAFGADRK